ncbi:MAG: TIGR01620 family protein [Rhodobacterales bacterium]
MKKKSVVIALEPANKKNVRPSPADVPAVPEEGQNALQLAQPRVAVQKPSYMGRLFTTVLVALAGFVISLAFWDFVTGMMARNLWLGRLAFALTGLFVLGLLFYAGRELAGFARLRRMDALRQTARLVFDRDDLPAARRYSDQLAQLYQGRQDLRWAFGKLKDQATDILDADAHMALVESTVVAELDKQAVSVIETSGRQVATATAIIPLALADVVVALSVNMRMIRRIAGIYGGRSGFFGSLRLMRAVAAHLVATGAVAIGDDMIGSIAGGSVISKLSRRFGEGVINGALTVRVGVAAMELCRPMRFHIRPKPSVTGIMKRALTGVFSKP